MVAHFGESALVGYQLFVDSQKFVQIIHEKTLNIFEKILQILWKKKGAIMSEVSTIYLRVMMGHCLKQTIKANDDEYELS